MNGQIAVYDTTKGSGIIILENKEKIAFDITQWNDADVPKLYDEVFVENTEGVLSIKKVIKVLSDDEKLENLFKLIEPNFRKIDFKVETSNKNQIVLFQEEEKEETFGIFRFIIFTFIFTLGLWLLFGVFGFFVALIVSFFLSKTKKIIKPFLVIELRIENGKIISFINRKPSEVEHNLEKEEICIFFDNYLIGKGKFTINKDGIKNEQYK